MQTAGTTIMALDVGERRIGIAIADSVARLARPFKTVTNATSIVNDLQALIAEHNVKAIVVGLPRGLSGQTTQQTEAVLIFINTLRNQVTVPIYEQDEAVTSVQAEAELATRKPSYAKGEVDALAATYILEDFLISGVEIT